MQHSITNRKKELPYSSQAYYFWYLAIVCNQGMFDHRAGKRKMLEPDKLLKQINSHLESVNYCEQIEARILELRARVELRITGDQYESNERNSGEIRTLPRKRK